MLKHSLTEAPYWISDPCKKHIYGKGPYKEHFKSNLLPNTVSQWFHLSCASMATIPVIYK